MKISLNDIFIRSAETGLMLQNSNGSMPAGHNGPWGIPETHVRNTAHWATTFYKAHDVSGEDRYLGAAIAACDYLLEDETRPYGKAFQCLHPFDHCNGLIGQVWAIEPLMLLGYHLKNREYLALSREILLLHRYEEGLHLWRDLELSGRQMGVNTTFNQQLWFAVSHLILGKIMKDKTLTHRAGDFFSNMNQNVAFLETGLIKHTISRKNLRRNKYVPDFFKRLVLEELQYSLRSLRELVDRNSTRERSIGYQPFILFGLAKAYEVSKEESWWRNPWFKNALQNMFNLVQGDHFFRELSASRYAWTYNPVGFEIAYALDAFKDLINVDGGAKSVRWWVERQLNNHWNPSSGLMENNTDHPLTLSARLYEGAPLGDLELNINLTN